MKTINLLKYLSLFLLLASCCNVEEMTPESQPRKIRFHVRTINYAGQTPMFAQTRALKSEPEFFFFMDVLDGKVVEKNIVVRDSIDCMEPLEMLFDTGNHELYFVAAANKYNSYDAENRTMKWEDEKLNLVWAKKIELDVTRETLDSQSVDLNLVVARLTLKITDRLPEDLATITTSGDSLSWNLNLETMAGIPESVTNTLAIPASYIGQTDKEFSTYTFVPENGKVGSVSFAAYNNADTPQLIKEYTVTDVPVEMGWRTLYSGWFFGNGGTFSFTYDTDWKGLIEKYF